MGLFSPDPLWPVGIDPYHTLQFKVGLSIRLKACCKVKVHSQRTKVSTRTAEAEVCEQQVTHETAGCDACWLRHNYSCQTIWKRTVFLPLLSPVRSARHSVLCGSAWTQVCFPLSVTIKSTAKKPIWVRLPRKETTQMYVCKTWITSLTNYAPDFNGSKHN